MKVNVIEKEHYVIFQLDGTLIDDPDVLIFYHQIKKFLAKGCKNFIIDFKKVPWINSTVLGMLVCGMASIRKAEGEMKLTRLSGVSEKLFTVAQLDKIFNFYERVEDAAASFKND